MQQKNNVIDCYNKTAKSYSDTYFEELNHKPLDRLLLKNFAQECQGKIIDLGCGCGHTTRFLYQAGATDILGADIASEMIAIATGKNKDIGIDFQVQNMLQMTFADNSFAGAVAFYAIVHFTEAELERAFAEIYRIVEKGGQFLFSFHVGEEHRKVEEFLNEKVEIEFHFFEVETVLQKLKNQHWTIEEALVRYPYQDKEYPSQRAYIRCRK